MKSLYLAGPMRGIKDFNFPAFAKATAWLRSLGCIVFSPAEEDEATWGKEIFKSETGDMAELINKGPQIRDCMKKDVTWITTCADSIVCMPGWEGSKGALAEIALARAIGISVEFMNDTLDGFGPNPLQDTIAYTTAGIQESMMPTRSQDSANPKDLLGMAKPQLHLVPPALLIHTAKAMENGAKKYGPYNWRAKKIRYTVYIAAAMRHLLSLLDGEDVAEDSGCHHAGHAAACMGIILDAVEGGHLIDDRPAKGTASAAIKRLTVSNSVDQTAPNPLQ